jgi:hypothetical protein
VVLLVLNVIFIIFGAVIVFSGAQYLDHTFPGDKSNAMGEIGMGVATALIGILGCVMTFLHQKSVFNIYNILILLMAIVQFAIGALILNMAGNMVQVSNLANSVWNIINDKLRSDFQVSYRCCGFSAPVDRPGSYGCISPTQVPCRFSLVQSGSGVVRTSGIVLIVTALLGLSAVVLSFISVQQLKRTKKEEIKMKNLNK